MEVACNHILIVICNAFKEVKQCHYNKLKSIK